METKERTILSYLTLSPQDKLAALRKVRGIWKYRKPDPIKELNKIRKELDRFK